MRQHSFAKNLNVSFRIRIYVQNLEFDFERPSTYISASPTTHLTSGYDRSTDQTDKSADLSEFADYRYYQSDKPLYRIGIGSADYKGPYRLIGMGIKRAHIGANLVNFYPSNIFEPLKNFDPCLENFES